MYLSQCRHHHFPDDEMLPRKGNWLKLDLDDTKWRFFRMPTHEWQGFMTEEATTNSDFDF